MWFRSPVARALYVIAGAIVGIVMAMTSSACCSSEEWLVWAPSALAFTVASGAVFGYGLARWPEIAALGQVRRRRAATLAGVVLTVTVALVILGFWVPQPVSGNLRGRLIVSFAVLSAIPALAGLDAIRDIARALSGAPGEQAETLLALRRLLSGLLAAGGALLALFILATGAALQTGSNSSPAALVFFGGMASATVALAYAWPASAWRASARAWCRTITPLANASSDDVVARVEERRRLEQVFGVDRGVFADLQSGITIFAPLLASAAAVFLPG